MITLVELPLVLPPAVAGIGLLAAFGRFGLLGGTLSALGIEVGFTQTAVVLAVAYVASPFYLRQAIAAFEGLDGNAARRVAHARRRARRARSRGSRSRSRARGLAAGAALSFARGIGEFGATIMFAGSLQGVTQTLSLAIYCAVRRRLRHRARARRAARARQPRRSSWRPDSSRYGHARASTSPFLFARSTSS